VSSLIRLGIVDDHPVFRLGLRRSFEREPDLAVLWELGSTAELIETLHSNPVDVVLMDLNLGPDDDALAATRTIRERHAEVKVIVVSASLDWEAAAASRHAGASGYLPKDLSVGDMVAAIRGLADPTLGLTAFGDLRKPPPTNSSSTWIARAGLTKREHEVLYELRRGRSNSEIAKRFGVSVTTVNKHVHQVLRKLRLKTRAQVVARLHAETSGPQYGSGSSTG
jgi:DNA-binding NarL/FixJ family response regulator